MSTIYLQTIVYKTKRAIMTCPKKSFIFFICFLGIIASQIQPACSSEKPSSVSLNEQLNFFGYGSLPEVSSYLTKLQSLAKEDPSDLLGELRYPYSLYRAGEIKAVFKSKKEALSSKTPLLTKKVLKSLSDQKAESLFVNYQGVMIGDGEIWINQTEQGEYYIKTINP